MGVHRWDCCQWSVKGFIRRLRPAILPQREFSPGSTLIQGLQQRKQTSLDKIKKGLGIQKGLCVFLRDFVFIYVILERYLFPSFLNSLCRSPFLFSSSLSLFLLIELNVSGLLLNSLCSWEDPEFMIWLPRLPRCGGYRCVPPGRFLCHWRWRA